MAQLEVSHDTREFEVPAELDENGRLTRTCAKQVCKVLDDHGFVVIPRLLTDEEAAAGLGIVREAIADPHREMGAFASQTDIRYKRRDFCPLPSTEPVLSYAAMLCRRLDTALIEYCGRTRPVLEISTLTSYLGSSHQYIHRDPDGVICLFTALDDISPAQGGTVFVPGTHKFSGAEMKHGGKANLLMGLYQTLCNMRILRYNLANLQRIRKRAEPPITRQEYRDRVFSRRYDNHQPNLLRFFLGKNPVFSLSKLGPSAILKLLRKRKELETTFRLIQSAPAKGTVILYRSDMLHAGPDNRSAKPRFFFSMSLARDIILPKQWRDGYSPHSSLLAEPKTLGDLLDRRDEPPLASSAAPALAAR
jgi:hypothetical protein